jgi:hypothetical protein
MHERIRERPILFSAPMVVALLDGSKTQTRRLVKGEIGERDGVPTLNGQPLIDCPAVLGQCPYGAPGDRLWVREKLYLHRHAGDRGGWLYAADNAHVTVKATDDDAVLAMRVWAHHVERDYCVSIHMPRWASRITLEVTEVRVQRLQDISEEDCAGRGNSSTWLTWRHYALDRRVKTIATAFSTEARPSYTERSGKASMAPARGMQTRMSGRCRSARWLHEIPVSA